MNIIPFTSLMGMLLNSGSSQTLLQNLSVITSQLTTEQRLSGLVSQSRIRGEEQEIGAGGGAEYNGTTDNDNDGERLCHINNSDQHGGRKCNHVNEVTYSLVTEPSLLHGLLSVGASGSGGSEIAGTVAAIQIANELNIASTQIAQDEYIEAYKLL
jgi:hypothetical protein